VIFNVALDYIKHALVEIKMQGSDTFLVGCIYCSPSKPSISSLCDLLGQLGGYSHLLICGDFNLKDITWLNYCGNSTIHYIEPFLDKRDNLFLFQYVTGPTRYRSTDQVQFVRLGFYQ